MIFENEISSLSNFMCALKHKSFGQKAGTLNPFEKQSDKEKSLLDMNFGYFWYKIMIRRNIAVFPVLSIVGLTN